MASAAVAVAVELAPAAAAADAADVHGKPGDAALGGCDLLAIIKASSRIHRVGLDRQTPQMVEHITNCCRVEGQLEKILGQPSEFLLIRKMPLCSKCTRAHYI